MAGDAGARVDGGAALHLLVGGLDEDVRRSGGGGRSSGGSRRWAGGGLELGDDLRVLGDQGDGVLERDAERTVGVAGWLGEEGLRLLGVLGAQLLLGLTTERVLARSLSEREVGVAGHDQAGGDEGDDAEPGGDLAGDQRAIPGRRMITHGS